MITRQRTMLYLLKKAGNTAPQLQTNNWAFILAHDTVSGGGDTFYDFVPYKTGPVSFSLRQEAAKLCQKGLLSESAAQSWQLTPQGESEIGKLPWAIRNDVWKVLKEYGNVPNSVLTEKIHRDYPWYTTRSQRSRPTPNRRLSPKVFTAGYEGLSVDSFLNRLLQNGITRVIDVRKNPIARRYGFHKKTLDSLCDKVGIGYCHFPNLGIPSAKRKKLTSVKDYHQLFEEYEQTVLKQQQNDVLAVAELIKQRPSVLTCSEADPNLCHRTIVARHIRQLTGLPMRDLGAA